MGFGDKMDDLKDKAKEAMGQHGDQVNQGMDKAGQFVDDKTGGKHSDQIQKGVDEAKDRAQQFGGQ
ncbi:MAG TPA: antitoxin [Pseudonocardiaceae bacterium]|jgi:hypothetical protein|nr:antitoxin [Pseudonocardiaceae bacterium]